MYIYIYFFRFFRYIDVTCSVPFLVFFLGCIVVLLGEDHVGKDWFFYGLREEETLAMFLFLFLDPVTLKKAA